MSACMPRCPDAEVDGSLVLIVTELLWRNSPGITLLSNPVNEVST